MDESDDHQSLGPQLDDLATASKIPAKRRGVSIKPTIESITSLSYERGLIPADLVRLVDLITASGHHLDQASLGALVRSLYPAGPVSDDVVLTVVGSLGHGQLKPSLPIQSLLLRWLVMIYHILDSRAVLSQSYPVLFNLLDTAAIRPQLCHLLALVTRRKHVRPFRIQSILDLSRQTGHDPSLVGLLRIYKNYYPEVIVGDVTRGKASPFKYPDPEWRERLGEIQAAHRLRQDRRMADSGPRNGFRVNHNVDRRKSTLLPPVQTSHANEESVTIEEIDSVEQFVDNLEKLELPNQLVAVLADPLLQKLLMLRPDATAGARISNWLDSSIADAADDAHTDGGRALLDLLELVHDHAEQTQSLHPLFDRLLHQLYPAWNGKDRRNVVLDTLTFIPLGSFAKLYEVHFRPVESKVLDDTPEPQLALLEFYTCLLRRWTVQILSLTGAVPKHAPDAVAALTGHVNKLCLTLAQQQSPPAATSTHMRIIGFYDAAARLISNPSAMPHMHIVAPPAAVLYALGFSDSPAVLSGLCGVLARYKRGLEVIMSGGGGASRPRLTVAEREQVAVFNRFFMDTCNCLWRGRALEKAGDNAVGCGLADAVIAALERWATAAAEDEADKGGKALKAMYGVSRSPALCLAARDFLQGLEEAEMRAAEAEAEPLLARHAGPASQQSLARLARDGGLDVQWQEFRLGVLDEFQRLGFGGVPDLLYQAMKGLMGTRARAAQGQGGG
ncbi:hypothetical protein GGTG_07965 [Gaeumannomyces tritici R3-111a-1]|uniref:Mis6 domain-containing protein n=1 Tax=Gaeumannomyces tritici (strain R3-111a-1) TaxID=644352 RepID=J3P375_GAET3|nr:hypothetical protein GGTG_07965 [Gaeumannomyces tritici R3-111a-1]EJT74117.1 hypothetical protein GGTG_07965 [Gaeumannomyces tritici R3-111a-1]